MILRSLPRKVKIVEVAPRDGLQHEPEPVPVGTKVAFIEALAAAGPAEIEITSFVSPRWIPQLADAEEVARRVRRPAGVSYSALVPNLKGLERALVAGVNRVAVFTAASDAFNLKNIRVTIAESIRRFKPVVERARAAGIGVRGYVSTAFVCPFDGPVAPARTREVVDRLLQLGVEEIVIGDTIGAAVPVEVDRLLDALEGAVPFDRLALHLHDTRGTALPNVLLALQRGITTFDASAGGLGGCPYAPGAGGNLATEDLVFLLEGLGIETGIDLDALRRASDLIEQALGRRLPSRVRRAGPVARAS